MYQKGQLLYVVSAARGPWGLWPSGKGPLCLHTAQLSQSPLAFPRTEIWFSELLPGHGGFKRQTCYLFFFCERDVSVPLSRELCTESVGFLSLGDPTGEAVTESRA